MITRVDNGLRSVVKVNQPKFVYYSKLKCIAVYWGLAQVYESQKLKWTTYNWLNGWIQEQEKYDKIEDFVAAMGTELKNIIAHGIGTKVNQHDRGIGIHVAGFEKVGVKTIPELYLISNFKNPCYEVGEMSWSRRTAADFVIDSEKKTFEQQKIELNEKLEGGEIFYFNNGDPYLFNPFAHAVLSSISMTRDKFFKEREEITILRQMASYPIELTKKFQRTYYHKNEIKIGGRVYNHLFSKEGNID